MLNRCCLSLLLSLAPCSLLNLPASTTTTAVAAFAPATTRHYSSSPSSPVLLESPSSSTTTQLHVSPLRKPFITGNWKLNPQTKQEAQELAAGIAAAITPSSPNADVALFVPFPFMEIVHEVVGDKIAVGAEMVTPEMKGAFTGGISPIMLKSVGIDWALAGHSERRTINKETDEYINAQCVKLIEQDMNVILCIGETDEEFEKNLVANVCEVQLRKGLAGVPAQDVLDHVTVAYEPVWAIGTGKVATPEIAQDVHAICRRILSDMYGESVSRQVRILYGGSVGPDSVDGLLSKPDIDGALVGGASLSAEKFGRIINFQVDDALLLQTPATPPTSQHQASDSGSKKSGPLEGLKSMLSSLVG